MASSVLILEDEYLMAAMLAELVADAGYKVVGPVASVEKAQALINENGIDAALLDIKLRGDNRSLDLAARLQAMRVHFAFITAYSHTLLGGPFRDVPYLAKPVLPDAVAKLLRQLLASPSDDRA